ncbi:MAG: GGDEF domain-containing protein [Piscinibacter sp.]|uniref:GGDEF domain-containing protein n=1 Tax=Piscinibacter TaxID=1114981 RepID=UPI000FDDE69C|nr:MULTISPECIES: GGDEF domain-containing protein [Piscinibacter]MCW5665005.1 GGDEF domain-containing protein [Piscinibacter sp.]
MHYPDSKDRSAELLRLAIPKMAEQPAPLHPITYAVWYDYLSGRNLDLKAEVDAVTARKVPLGDELVYSLYSRHIAEAAEQATRRVSEGLREMIDDVGRSTSATGEQVSGFRDSLEAQGRRLQASGHGPAIDESVAELLAGTRDTGASLAALAARLEAATAELQELRRELDLAKVQATLDALTGVTNRRGFDEAMLALLEQQPAGEAGPSVVLIDLDHFKQINDRYGHVFGDTVLKAVAQAIRSCVKGRDLVARYGGEEFVVLLPGTDVAGACALAEQVRTTISGARIRRGGTNEMVGAITVSLGVATRRPAEGMQSLVERADQALYRSKTGGRNQVSVDE